MGISTYLTEEVNEMKAEEIKEEEKTIIKGIPGMVILPLRQYTLKTLVSSYTFSVPISGKFSEMYPDFFEQTKKTRESDNFDIAPVVNNNKFILPIGIIELLLASSKYPDLEDNQVFAIGSMAIHGDDNVLHITGSLFEMVEE